MFPVFITEESGNLEKSGMVPPWPVWRPIPSTFSPSYMPNDRSLYTLYGGLFGLNTNFMIPPMAFHSLVNANNLRLRDGIPTTSASFTDSVYPSTSSYRYHPYLTPDKIAAAQKAAESSVAESCRHWNRHHMWNTIVFHTTLNLIKLVLVIKKGVWVYFGTFIKQRNLWNVLKNSWSV